MARTVPLARLRNIGIMAHIDAGKTTTSERILYDTGRTRRMGEVDAGSATMDWMEQEQERGITITAASTSCHWRSTRGGELHQLNLIDTPGHVDFTVEVERSLRVLDGAVALFCGVSGVQPQSEAVWRQAERYKIPRLAFINKLDRPGADLGRVLEMMRARLRANPIQLQLPIGQEDDLQGVVDLIERRAYLYEDDVLDARWSLVEVPEGLEGEVARLREALIEAVSDFDEGLMEAYLSGEEVEPALLREAIRGATLRGEVVPVLCGSSLHNKGIQPLLDAVLDFLPSPLEGQPILGLGLDGAQVPCQPDEAEPFAALAFKLMGDAREGALTYFRVYAGRLRVGDEVLNSSRGARVRVGALVRMHANDREEIGEVSVGDIAAAVSLEGVLTGDTLCDPARPLVLSTMSFPEPVIERRIEPQTEEEAQKLERVLGLLALEDPSFRVRVDPDSGQTLIAGMGELHLEILGERITREWKVQARLGAPQVAYRETVSKEGQARGRFERQLAALRALGEVEVRVRPLERGAGLRLVVESAGEIPEAHLPAVEEGLREAVRRGFMAGFPLVDAEVAVVGGGAPIEGASPEASAMAYRLAAATGLREAVASAQGCVLEPIMSLEVLVPGEFLGTVMGDLQRREARVEDLEGRGEVQAIAAWAPLRTMFGHATELRSQTQGRGTCSMRFDHYELAGEALAQALAGRAWVQA